MPRCRPTHKVPNFNLPAWIWNGGNRPYTSPHDVAVLAQLVCWVPGAAFGSTSGNPPGRVYSYLYVPALTPALHGTTIGQSSCFQINPPGGRIYAVGQVEDVAKGFANEFRILAGFNVPEFPWLLQLVQGAKWEIVSLRGNTT